ncbi:MAG: WD40 repeat domain-containing protein [Bdellovibrionales bacterium]|nr:WD40 repeat domain-containing protein [Bdellovibrionales bacterium]
MTAFKNLLKTKTVAAAVAVLILCGCGSTSEQNRQREESSTYAVDVTESTSASSVNWSARFPSELNAPLKQALSIPAHDDEVTKLVFAPDGGMLVSISYGDYHLKLWDAATGAQLGWQKSPDRPVDAVMSPTGKWFVTADVYGNLRRWPISRDGVGMYENIAEKTGKATKIALSPDGRRLAVTSWDSPMSVWDLARRKKIKVFEGTEKMRSVAFVPGTQILASGNNQKSFILWDLSERSWWERWFSDDKTEFVIPKVSPQSDVASLDVSQDGNLLATGHMDSSITLWDLGRRRQLKNYFVRDASTLQVAFSPHGSLLASANQDGRVYLWDGKSGVKYAELSGHGKGVKTVAFSPTEEKIASGGEDGKILIWE